MTPTQEMSGWITLEDSYSELVTMVMGQFIPFLAGNQEVRQCGI